LTVVGHQTTPDEFLVSPPRLNHCLSIAVASPDVISDEFFPVTRAHVLTKAAKTTKYIRQLTTTSLFSARFTTNKRAVLLWLCLAHLQDSAFYRFAIVKVLVSDLDRARHNIGPDQLTQGVTVEAVPL
jgi:hypothetical protein